MKFALPALLVFAGLAAAQCPPGPKAAGACQPKAAAPMLTWSAELGAWVQVMAPAPVRFVAVPPPPQPRVLYVPMAPAYVAVPAPPPKKFPTPIRDFFFGR